MSVVPGSGLVAVKNRNDLAVVLGNECYTLCDEFGLKAPTLEPIKGLKKPKAPTGSQNNLSESSVWQFCGRVSSVCL